MGRIVTRLTPGEIGPDTPLRLSRAVEFAFPAGGMTVSGLRREAARGNLTILRCAGKDFTTLANIERMLELCQKPTPKRQTPAQPAKVDAYDVLMAKLAAPAQSPRISAQDQLTAKLKALKEIEKAKTKKGKR